MNGATVRYVHAGPMEISETDAAGNILVRYVPGAGIDQRTAMMDLATGETFYYHTGRLGHVVALADGTGTITDQYLYTPFGIEEPLNTSANPFRYTGRRYDPETGLYYYRARYYDPEGGRFLETDPIGYKDGPNWYLYVANDPVNMRDPFGLKAEGGHTCRTEPDGTGVCDTVTVTPDPGQVDRARNKAMGKRQRFNPLNMESSPAQDTPKMFRHEYGGNSFCGAAAKFAEKKKGKDSDQTHFETTELSAGLGISGGMSRTNIYDARTGLYGYMVSFGFGGGFGGGISHGEGIIAATPHEMSGVTAKIDAGIGPVGGQVLFTGGEGGATHVGTSGSVGTDRGAHLKAGLFAELASRAEFGTFRPCEIMN